MVWLWCDFYVAKYGKQKGLALGLYIRSANGLVIGCKIYSIDGKMIDCIFRTAYEIKFSINERTDMGYLIGLY